MAFDYNENFCKSARKTKNDLFFNLNTLKFLSLKLFNQDFKLKLKKKIFRLNP